MSLSILQRKFSYNVAKLIIYIYDELHMSCSHGESWRTPEQAKLYYEQRKGSLNSLHCDRLAIDLNLFDQNGNYLTKTEDYAKICAYWKSLDPANRWGGDFKNRPDGNHMSMSPDGIRG